MKSYLAIARKYRPQKFSDIVGQHAAITTLKNAILLNKLSHAYIFCGCRGTGKTTLARILSKALNCSSRLEDNEPCNQCNSCKEITSSQSIDVIEIDGASHRGIDDIRQINESIMFSPSKSKFKIYIIDEIHMLTKEAFNALLKTIEEPPSHVKFFFATTEHHKIPQTILSRCQTLILKRISTNEIADKLKFIGEDLGISSDKEALLQIAEQAQGSLRDAESLFDKIISYSPLHISLECVLESLGHPQIEVMFLIDRAIRENKPNEIFNAVASIFDEGHNISYFIELLIQHFRKCLIYKYNIPNNIDKMFLDSVNGYTENQLIFILEFLGSSINKIKNTIFERSFLETSLLHILKNYKLPDSTLLLHELKNIKASLLHINVKEETLHISPPKISTPQNTKEHVPKEHINIKTSSKKEQTPEIAIQPAKKEDLKNDTKSPAISTQKNTINPCIADTLMQFAAVEFKSSLSKS